MNWKWIALTACLNFAVLVLCVVSLLDGASFKIFVLNALWRLILANGFVFYMYRNRSNPDGVNAKAKL
jgi:hypothetical protein